MGTWYEVVLSVFLRDDIPPAVLDESRWHLELAEQRPASLALESKYPLLKDWGSRLPGNGAASLERKLRWGNSDGGHYAWGLFARVLMSDDALPDALEIAEWLAPYADEDGYFGQVRSEARENPTVIVVRGGQLSQLAA